MIKMHLSNSFHSNSYPFLQGTTSYIEGFNNTLRQRVSRLVRKTLSFSKSIEHHIGAIWNFIYHYNAQIQAQASIC
jgi:insertion element IS1 protein InsB